MSGGRVSGTDIFLSYARHDRATARIFAESLADEGFHVWWDASLHSGETFDEVIEQRLRDAKAVVVLWSPRSVASRWVRAEATQADRRNKLVPAIIEDCDRPIVFELTHTAELSGWEGDRSDVRWRTFVDDLGRLVDRNEQDAPAGIAAKPASAQPASRQPLRPGSEEVIFAARAQRAQPVQPPLAAARASAGQDEGGDEVHCLELADGDLEEELFVVDSSSLKIGRNAPADIVLPHKSVSREHCVIGLANDELFVTDLNSTNGTYIDDVRVSRATILPVGSVVRIGQISLRHAIRSSDDAAGQGSLHATQPAGRLAAAR
jgi:hypothetical protein